MWEAVPCQGQGVVAHPLTVKKEPPALTMCSLLPVACEHLTHSSTLVHCPCSAQRNLMEQRVLLVKKGGFDLWRAVTRLYTCRCPKFPTFFIKNKVVQPVQKCPVLYQFEDNVLEEMILHAGNWCGAVNTQYLLQSFKVLFRLAVIHH